MARIRTVKPDFFEDEDVGLLSREARLLFIAAWTLADDEGLLRWAVPYLKANVFMYDDDLGSVEVAEAMAELEQSQMIFAYKGGKTQQRLGWIVNFRRHQKINRPQPGKLPPPSIQNPQVTAAYCRRDQWRCAICGEEVIEDPARRRDIDKAKPSLDHITPRSEGGSDYPSNLRLAHKGCNSRRGADPVPDSGSDSPTAESEGSLTDSVNGSLSEGKGKEGKGRGREEESTTTGDPDPISRALDHVAFARQIPSPDPEIVATACARYADRDIPAEAEAFAHYWTSGPGAKRALRDVGWHWRSWLKRAEPRKATRTTAAAARASVTDDLRRLEEQAAEARAAEGAAA